jgi:F-type H+-transporting ATPase subunit b
MEALGINLFSIAVYTVLFVIVYVLLNKYLLPGLRRSINDRQKLIEDNVRMQGELKQDAEAQQVKLQKKEKEVVSEARKRGEQIITDAETEASEIIKSAKNKAQNILADGKIALETKEQKLVDKLNEEVRLAAVKLAKEVYGKDGKEIDAQAVAKAVAEIDINK